MLWRHICNPALVPLQVDVTTNNHLAVTNTKLLADYAAIDGRLAQLVFVVKAWAKVQQAQRRSMCCGHSGIESRMIMAMDAAVLMPSHHFPYHLFSNTFFRINNICRCRLGTRTTPTAAR